jgi:hypothetical protein
MWTKHEIKKMYEKSILQQGLKTTLPSILLNQNWITKLNLEKNKLRFLPQEICDMNSISYLNISYNNITVLPDEIKHLTSIEYFNISNNQLMILNKHIGHLKNMSQLVLRNNKLSSLPQEFIHLTKLECLSIDYTELKRFDIFEHYIQQFLNTIDKETVGESKILAAFYYLDIDEWYDCDDESIEERKCLLDERYYEINFHYRFSELYEVSLSDFLGLIKSFYDRQKETASVIIQKHMRGNIIRNKLGVHNPHCSIGKEFIRKMFNITNDY